MRYSIGVGGKRRWVELDNGTLLGKGGEKTVHRDPDHPRSQAIAVYHDPTTVRAAKIAAFMRGPLVLPQNVMGPLEDVQDTNGQIVGFGMKQLSRRYAKLKQIFVPSFRRDNNITTQTVCDVFLRTREDLDRIHREVGAIGDLNDGAILLNEDDHDIAWVDVDSWSIGKFPCIVGTRLYLCPALYGVDLSKGNFFQPWHDDYSFCVLLFRSLLGQHPFKAGSHSQFSDVTERAQAGLTLLDPEVDKSGVKFFPDLLTDDLANALLMRLKLREKSPLSLDLLRAYREQLIQCPSCGLSYPASRAHCPSCAAITTVDMRTLLGVTVTELVETTGTVLYVQLDGTTVYCIAEEAGTLFLYIKQDAKQVECLPTGIKFRTGMRFALLRGTLVICLDDDTSTDDAGLFLIDVTPSGVRAAAETTTSVLAGREPVFSTSERFLYRLAGNMLIAEERFGSNHLAPHHVTEVFENQCWFAVDPNPGNNPETIFGINRDVTKDICFVVTGTADGRVFDRREVLLPELTRGESLRDLNVEFDGGQVLVMRKTIRHGLERTRIETITAKTGAVISSEIVDSSSQPLWDNIHGKAFANGKILHPTDIGILPEILDGHRIKTALRDTATLVSAADSLKRYDKGVLVVRKSDVLLVTPR